MPVLFGSGIRYFGELVGGHVMLEDPIVVEGVRALHLRYEVRRRPGRSRPPVGSGPGEVGVSGGSGAPR